jgi:hypothetical protein
MFFRAAAGAAMACIADARDLGQGIMLRMCPCPVWHSRS